MFNPELNGVKYGMEDGRLFYNKLHPKFPNGAKRHLCGAKNTKIDI